MNFPLKTDKSTRNFFSITLGSMLLFALFVLLFDRENIGLLLILTGASIVFHYVLYKTSSVQIEQDEIIGRVLVFKKKVKIAEIRYVEYNHSWSYSGSSMKVALSKHNLIVHYQKYEEFLIGPADEEAFIRELQRLNPEIYTKGEPRSPIDA